MSLPISHTDRDHQAYREVGGEVTRHVSDMMGPSGSIVAGIIYDEIQATYPTSTTEIFVYKLATVIVATVTATYLTSSKKDISSIVRT